jgi:hypothetical protein
VRVGGRGERRTGGGMAGGGEPSAEEARAALGLAHAATVRTARAAKRTTLGVGLIAWGVAWLLGYAGLQFLPFFVGWGAWVPLGIAAFVATRLLRDDTIRSGWEGRFERAWWVVVFGTPLLVSTVTPAEPIVLVLLPGALWGLALLLYAVVSEERALAAFGATLVVLAPLLRQFLPEWGALLFGLVGGGGMVGLGLWRGGVGSRGS